MKLYVYLIALLLLFSIAYSQSTPATDVMPHFKEVWHCDYKPGFAPYSELALNGNFLFILLGHSNQENVYDLKLAKINTINHKLITLNVPDELFLSTIHSYNEKVFLWSYKFISCFTNKSASIKWTKVSNNPFAIFPIFGDNKAIYLTGIPNNGDTLIENSVMGLNGKYVYEKIQKYIVALNVDSGKELWGINNAKIRGYAAAIDDKTHKLFITSKPDELTAYDDRTGKLLKSIKITQPRKLLCSNGKLVLVSQYGIHCYDTETMKLIWKFSLTQNFITGDYSAPWRQYQEQYSSQKIFNSFPALLKNNILTVERPLYHELYSFDLISGKIIQKIETKNISFNASSLDGEMFVMYTKDLAMFTSQQSDGMPKTVGLITLINVKTGKKAAEIATTGFIAGSPIIDASSKTVYWGDLTGIKAFTYSESN